MLFNLCTIILHFLLTCTNRCCANLPRMSVRGYGSIKRKKESVDPERDRGSGPPLENHKLYGFPPPWKKLDEDDSFL